MQLILSGGNQQLTRVESNSKLGTRVSSRQVQVIIDGHRVRTLARPMVGPEAAQIRWVVGGRDPTMLVDLFHANFVGFPT